MLKTSWPLPIRLEAGKPESGSTLGDVRLVAFRPSLPSNYIEIAVEYAALNFKDVLKSLGLLDKLTRVSGEELGAQSMGLGCVGHVVRVGADVNGKRVVVGDVVLAFASGCIATRVQCPEHLVIRLIEPVPAPFAVLSCITLYATAWEAIINRGQLNVNPGSIVLIHSAASGVGQCAIQLAKHFGARMIIATAGTSEKREFLKTQLGITQVTDSRCVATFVNDVTRWTQGKGADLVLNSLSGEAQAASLSLCAPGGRFIEIGKRDILEGHNLALTAMLRNVSFVSCQLDLLLADAPSQANKLLQDVMQAFQNHIFSSIELEEYPLEQFSSALTLAASGTTMKKAVFKIGDLGRTQQHDDSEGDTAKLVASPDMESSSVAQSNGKEKHMKRKKPSLTSATWKQQKTESHAAHESKFEANHNHHETIESKSNGSTSLSFPISEQCMFDPEGAYLVTGGLGGLGLHTAAMLASRGAGAVVLLVRDLSRMSKRHGHHLQMAQELNPRTKFLIRTCDVSNYQQVESTIRELNVQQQLKIRGVFHLAAALEDGLISVLDETRFLTPILSKAVGAWNLHRATISCGLETFFMCTSTQDYSGVEQNNYISANLIMQQLVHFRRSIGLCGSTVALGPVLGTV